MFVKVIGKPSYISLLKNNIMSTYCLEFYAIKTRYCRMPCVLDPRLKVIAQITFF